jgi:hypothetical protein
MRKAFIVILTILIFSSGHAHAETLTVALFDLSGSVLTDSTGNEGKESPYNRNMAELKKEIYKLSKGDMLIVIGFARKSDVTLLKVTMPRQGGPRNQNLNITRQAAIRKLQENISNKSNMVDKSRTDIIGGLLRASRLFEESDSSFPDKQKKLLIYSDMLDNETLGLSLNHLKTRKPEDLIKRLENSRIGFPNLKNIEVEIYSAFSDIKGINTVETERAIQNLKALWMEFFLKSGAKVKSYRTSY